MSYEPECQNIHWNMDFFAMTIQGKLVCSPVLIALFSWKLSLIISWHVYPTIEWYTILTWEPLSAEVAEVHVCMVAIWLLVWDWGGGGMVVCVYINKCEYVYTNDMTQSMHACMNTQIHCTMCRRSGGGSCIGHLLHVSNKVHVSCYQTVWHIHARYTRAMAGLSVYMV